MSFCDLAVAGVAQLQPYVPGKPIEELERQFGITNAIKLASNENPLGPSQAALKAITEASKDISLYPDGNGFKLKSALAKKFNLAAEQITLGNGSNDVLEMLVRAFVNPGDEVVFSEHAFAVYPIATQAVGGKGVVTKAANYGHDLNAMHDAVTAKTKLLFIANPNNPTGTYLPLADIRAFLDKIPERVIVVLDEAYVEYNDESESSVSWLVDYPNLVITRTFSKAYGLAGLRVGYAMSHPEVADLLNRVRQPFNVNILALNAALATLDDQDYLQQTRAVNEAGMQQLTQGFRAMGLNYIPSRGNFISVDVKTNGVETYEALLAEGVIVRPVANYGLPRHLRVSIGLEAENQRFLDALATVLGINS